MCLVEVWEAFFPFRVCCIFVWSQFEFYVLVCAPLDTLLLSPSLLSLIPPSKQGDARKPYFCGTAMVKLHVTFYINIHCMRRSRMFCVFRPCQQHLPLAPSL